MVLLSLLFACSPEAAQLTSSTPTSGGSWTVSLPEATLGTGAQYLALAVVDAAGRPAEDLVVNVQVGIVDYGYAAEPEVAAEQPDHTYAFYADLEYEGVWVVLGDVARERTTPETFILQVEAL